MTETASAPPPSDLDLAGTIRPGLDILANEIVIALKKRTRFPVNRAIYVPGLVQGDNSVSLLEHTLASVEQIHAGLGRYAFATQDAFTDISVVTPVMEREVPVTGIRDISVPVGPKVTAFYLSWIERACPPGDQTDNYGETVTADVGALMAILERVNLGRPVAESKFLDLSAEFKACNGSRECMRSLLVRKDREQVVLDLAAQLAKRYEMPEDSVVPVFEFMIETTVDVELDYLAERVNL